MGETTFMHRVNQKLLHDLTRKTEQILGIAAVRCAEEGVALKPLQDVGDPYVEIPRESHRFDLILLGRETHFQFGLEKIADDTLTRILHSSPRPVVVVPRTIDEREAVVIAFDGSLQASRALYAFEASGLGRAPCMWSALPRSTRLPPITLTVRSNSWRITRSRRWRLPSPLPTRRRPRCWSGPRSSGPA
jgi:hypothetical protein